MMRKRIKRGGALLLASALVFAAMVMPEAQAADAVDVDETCTITFDDALPEDNVSVPISLYKVASIDAGGTYTEIAPFTGLGLDGVSSKTTAEWWESCAEAAFKKVTANTAVAWSGTTSGGTVTTSGLETGMYLIVPQETKSDYYTYNFEPTLVSLPDNYYYDGEGDAWVYDVDLTLKPGQTERLGNLEIQKTLDNLNTTMGDAATFVFQVDITTPTGKEDTQFVAITYQDGEAGDQTAVVEDIPAGSQVTVTEVYSGAGYELISSADTTLEIVADQTVSSKFVNDSTGTWNGGYGVVNSYNVDEHGQYQWSSNAPAQEAE